MNTLIITAAVDGAPVHEAFYANLVAYAKYRDADLRVLRVPYPTMGPVSGLVTDRNASQLSDVLYSRGDVGIIPTAKRPLNDAGLLGGRFSAIIPHTRQHLRTVATTHRGYPKLLVTTGVCTWPRYAPNRAGVTASEHHVHGAVIVEFDGRLFHLRHINAVSLTGAFTDLTHYVTGGYVTLAPRAAVLTCGDVHVAQIDPVNEAATYEMLDLLRPRHVVLHDVFDMFVHNHHNADNPRARHAAERLTLTQELDDTVRWVEKLAESGDHTVHVVPSNHDDALDRWLDRVDVRGLGSEDLALHNKLTGLRLEAGPETRATTFALATKAAVENPRVHCLDWDETLDILGVEFGYHGHLGPNGARGSVEAFARLATKVTVGHSHTPVRLDGASSVGHLCRSDPDYAARAPSAWLPGNEITYADGKRTHLHIIEGKWRGGGA